MEDKHRGIWRGGGFTEIWNLHTRDLYCRFPQVRENQKGHRSRKTAYKRGTWAGKLEEHREHGDHRG